MSEHPLTLVGEHQRKRVRKGTRSCWECKRRKIKCVFQSEDHGVCAGCLDKGTNCLSQEYVDDASPREGNQALGQRLGRVEMMLEKLIEKVTYATEPERPPYGQDILTPSVTPSSGYEQAPFMSLFDDVLAPQSRGGIANGSVRAGGDMRPPLSNGATPPDGSSKSAPRMPRLEKLQRQLASMLPSQHDLDFLSDQSEGWWLIRRHILPHLVTFPDHDLSKPFDVEVVATGHPMVIARLLLCVALCIQQLPSTVDLRRLQTTIPLHEMMERIMLTIATMVTSDDELIGSIEGVECLLLQGVFQINAGNLRRSWLAFRRSINVAQLMGLHRVPLKTAQTTSDSTETRRHYLWYQAVKGDRYLSLILGVPSATGSAPFPFDDHAPWLSPEDLYNKHLCEISGLVLARNQGDSTHAFSSTQEIDEKLDALSKRMPRSWWDVPAVVAEGRSDEGYSQFDRMMSHIWHFELKTLVHLPFMLRAATSRRYEYSRVSCLSASRGLIRRWIFMRKAHGTSFVCNIVEFQAFTAAVTLLLGLLGRTNITTDPSLEHEQEEDVALVETVATILEGLKTASGLHVIDQSISVIRTLQGILHNDGDHTGNLRLNIPHFGTISVAIGGAMLSLDGEKIIGAVPQPDINSGNNPLGANLKEPVAAWGPMAIQPRSVSQQNTYNDMTGADVMNGHGNESATGSAWMKMPVLQFTSAQFPTFESGMQTDGNADWPFQESDIMFFDSLLHTDLEGNWDA